MKELLTISEEEVYRYLGAYEKSQYISAVMKDKIKNAIEEIRTMLMPRVVCSSIYPIQDVENELTAGNGLKLHGKDVKKHLKSCDGVILMAATLGNEVDALIRKIEVTDMAKAVIVDAIANVAIEEVCQNQEEKIRKLLEKQNQYLTMRYSPGYGDFPIFIQKDILRLTDAYRKIGLSVTTSCILTPRKSITAVMGVAKTEVKGKLAGCSNCVMREKCLYRKRGTTCG